MDTDDYDLEYIPLLVAQNATDTNRYLREFGELMKRLNRKSGKCLPEHLQWMDTLTYTVSDGTRQISGIESIYSLSLYANYDVLDNVLTYIDYNIRFIGREIDSQLEENSGFFPHKIGRLLHVWYTRIALQRFSLTFETLFPRFCFSKAPMTRSQIHHLTSHIEALRGVLQKQVQNMERLFDIQRFYLRQRKLFTDFKSSEAWFCERCHNGFTSEADVFVLDMCHHLYCAHCHKRFFSFNFRRFTRCPQCLKKVNLWDTIETIESFHTEDESMVRHKELHDAARRFSPTRELGQGSSSSNATQEHSKLDVAQRFSPMRELGQGSSSGNATQQHTMAAAEPSWTNAIQNEAIFIICSTEALATADFTFEVPQTTGVNVKKQIKGTDDEFEEDEEEPEFLILELGEVEELL